MGCIESDASNNSSVIAFVFVAARTYVLDCWLTTIGRIHMQTYSKVIYFLFLKKNVLYLGGYGVKLPFTSD
jgi:hypothetical protein